MPNMWNETADTYNQFAFSEMADSKTYLQAIGLQPGDTMLDVCCGPGRLSVLGAQLGAKVTGIDSAEKMLAHARENAQELGVADACDFRLMDWAHVMPGQNLERHDVVMASRCGAMMDIEKLSSLAKRTAAVQIFADAPSLPALWDVLFSGCEAPEGAEGGRGAHHGGPGAPAGMPPAGRPGMPMPPAGPGMPPMGRPGPDVPGAGGPGMPGGPRGFGEPPAGRAPSAYKQIIDKVYAHGFDPNVRIMPERFRRTFTTADEAVAWVGSLKPERAAGNEERLAHNVAPFLHEVDGGVEFVIATSAAIIWWDTRWSAAWADWGR